jgi:hypothetical protein
VHREAIRHYTIDTVRYLGRPHLSIRVAATQQKKQTFLQGADRREGMKRGDTWLSRAVRIGIGR